MKSDLSVDVGHLIDAGKVTLQTGPFGTQFKAAEYRAEGIPMINVKDIGYGSVKTNELERVGPDTRDRLNAHVVRSGDIVFGRKGAVERHAFIREDQDGWMQGSDCIRLRISSELFLPRYVSYTFLTSAHRQWMINQCSHGATMASLNQDILRRIKLPLMSIEEQSRIIAVLLAHDELIENNLRRVEILEEMAQAIYHEWFVKFRFPGHEQTEPIDSPLGPIPPTWKVCKLGDLVELAYGKALKAADRRGGPIAVYGSSGIVGHHDHRLVRGPGIVVGRKGNVGSVYWSDADFFPIDTTFYVKSDLPLTYLCFNLRGQHLINSDAAVPGLSRSQAYGNSLLVPDPQVLQQFAHHVEPMFNLRRNLDGQNARLREARDLLLPKLISGEIEVSDLDIDTSLLSA